MGEVPAFWRAFGPGLLGSAAIMLLTLFNGLNADLASLRHEVAREREARLGLVTRADLNAELADAEARLDALAGPAPTEVSPSPPSPSQSAGSELLAGRPADGQPG